MQLTLALLASAIGMALAAPSPNAKAEVEARQITSVGLVFYGADNDALYSITAPTDGSLFQTNQPDLSVSNIYNAGGAVCFIRGSEGSQTTVPINEHPVGPPQPQIDGRCYHN